MTSLRAATADDLELLYRIGAGEEGYFERCLAEKRLIIIAHDGEMDCAYGMLNHAPRYSLYQKLGYPEIQDVVVLPSYRQRGIATAIIAYLEQAARDQGYEGIGISVGITRDFGPAQRLYHKLGYAPDGYGVTCDREPVDAAGRYPVSELCVMMVKSLA